MHKQQLIKAAEKGTIDNYKGNSKALIKVLQQAEHFMFTAEGNSDDKEIKASIEAMREANVLRTPYPLCTFEFETHFQGTDGSFLFHGQSRTVLLLLKEYEPFVHGVFINTRLHGKETWFAIDFQAEETIEPSNRTLVDIGVTDGSHIMLTGLEQAALTGLVLLRTKGVRRERWAGTRKLIPGKPEPRITYTKVLVQEASDAGYGIAGADPRKRVRLHLRRGHIRHQPYGPGRNQTRMVFIDPMLVGYVEDGEIAHTEYRVRK